MKKLLLLIGLITAHSALSQNINFTDMVLKDRLLQADSTWSIAKDLNGNNSSVDLDNDNEISVAEALNISYLDLNYQTITTLAGIEFFTNLKFLRAQTFELTEFNQPALINLEELYLETILGTSALSLFDVSSNINLKKLYLQTEYVTSVDLSQNVNLVELDFISTNTATLNLDNLSQLRRINYQGNLPTLDLSDCVNLLEVTLGYYLAYADTFAISSIDLTNQPLLINLNICGTLITALDLSANINLENVDVSNNHIQTIAFGSIYYVKSLSCSYNELTTLNVNNFQNLTGLACGNNNLTGLSLKNFTSESYVSFGGNPDLAVICCDAEQVVYVQNQALLNGNYDTVVTSDCVDENLLAVTDFAQNNIALYPNPAKDRINFASQQRIDKVEITDVNGRLVQSDVISNNNQTIDVSSLKTGVYFVKAYAGSETNLSKLIKQ